MDEIKRFQEAVKLISNCLDERGIRPEFKCIIQKPDMLYSYNDKIQTIFPFPSDIEYAVNGKALAKFLSTKNIDGFEVTVANGEANFYISNKKMTLLTQNSDSYAQMSEVYKEIDEAVLVDIDENLQKDFIKILRQTYLPCGSNYAYAGVFIKAGGFTSTDRIQYSMYSATTPIERLVHIPSFSLDFLLKIKEPIHKLGFHEKTRLVYFFGVSGIIYVCPTTSISDDALAAHECNSQLVSEYAQLPYFTITEEAADSIEKASIAHDTFSTKIGFKLDGKAGQVYSKASDAQFTGDFSWDEATTFSFNVEVEYGIFSKYAKVGSQIHPVENDKMRGFFIVNEQHGIFIPQLS